MDENEIREHLELLTPIFIAAGHALQDCQILESALAVVLYQFGSLGVGGLDPSKFLLVLENRDKKTAGQLIQMLTKSKGLSFSDRIEAKLQEGLEARNAIVHRVIRDNIQQVKDVETRDELVEKINQLHGKLEDTILELQHIVIFNHVELATQFGGGLQLPET